MNDSEPLDFTTRQALLFALTAERLSAYYQHDQWLTEAQGATVAQLWLSRQKRQMPQSERRLLSALSDTLARQIAGSLSRQAGLFTAHEMQEALDPNYPSEVANDLRDECGRLLLDNGMGD